MDERNGSARRSARLVAIIAGIISGMDMETIMIMTCQYFFMKRSICELNAVDDGSINVHSRAYEMIS